MPTFLAVSVFVGGLVLAAIGVAALALARHVYRGAMGLDDSGESESDAEPEPEPAALPARARRPIVDLPQPLAAGRASR